MLKFSSFYSLFFSFLSSSESQLKLLPETSRHGGLQYRRFPHSVEFPARIARLNLSEDIRDTHWNSVSDFLLCNLKLNESKLPLLSYPIFLSVYPLDELPSENALSN